MATSTTTAQSVVEQAKAQVIAYNEKNWDAVKASLAPDAVYDEVATGRKVEGYAAILPVWKEWAASFPDSRATFESAKASNSTVTLELRWRGTHNGPLNLPSGKVQPTGKSIDLRACQVVDLVDGKARTIRHYFDLSTMLRQLGVGG